MSAKRKAPATTKRARKNKEVPAPLWFDTRVSTEHGEVVARLPQFGLVVSRPTFDAAIDALHDELLELCQDFMSDFDHYWTTDRIAHVPWLMRFLLTPADQRRTLLLEEPDPDAEPSRRTLQKWAIRDGIV